MVEARRLPARVDVLVVGAGPAGLASAIAANRAGLKVLVVDRAAASPDKACGEGLMPNAVAALARLGVVLPLHEGAPFRGIRFVAGKTIAQADFNASCGIGLRRTRLNRILLDHALAQGIEVHWHASAEAFSDGTAYVGGRPIACRWIVGADGINSRLRRSARMATAWQGGVRTAVRQHYRIRPWTDSVEVHWGQGFQAYVTPLGPDRICVALVGGDQAPDLASLAETLPELGRRLATAPIDSPIRGAISVSRRLASVRRGRLVLVGDASGSIDAVTGEGMALAFRQAEILGPALACDDIDVYEQAHQRIAAVPLAMSRVLLQLANHSRLRGAAFSLLQAQPWLFSRLLAAHVAETPASRFGSMAALVAAEATQPGLR